MKLKLPFRKGQLWVVRDPGQGNALFQSRLFVKHFRNEELFEERDLGTGVKI